MSDTLPPLHWFRAFEASARHLSFTGAAGELHITQSAISQNVRALEARLGTSLFIRKPRGIDLTESGRQLLPYISGAVDQLNEAVEIFSPDSVKSTIDLACSSSFAQLWLFPHLSKFNQAHPGIRIRVSSSLWPEDFSISMTDVQIRYGSGPAISGGARKLTTDQLIAVYCPDQIDSVDSAEEIWELPMIETVGTLDNWGNWGQSLGFNQIPHSSYIVDSHILAVELVKSVRSVALTSKLLCRNQINKELLAVVPVSLIDCKDNYFVGISKSTQKKDISELFVDWLLSQFVL